MVEDGEFYLRKGRKRFCNNGSFGGKRARQLTRQGPGVRQSSAALHRPSTITILQNISSPREASRAPPLQCSAAPYTGWWYSVDIHRHLNALQAGTGAGLPLAVLWATLWIR